MTAPAAAPTLGTPVLEAIRVSKVYPGAVPVTAVSDVSMAVRPGEMVAVQGPSGSGKSTLLGLLGLLDVPTEGAVLVEGQDTAGLRDAGRSQLRASALGFVFQQFNLISHLSALDNVVTALLYRRLSPRVRAQRAIEVLRQVGLGQRVSHRPGELSGGEQQRVALARAVVSRPRVILADEPTGNLDSESTERVLDVLLGFVADGVAVVVATHDPEVARRAHRRLAMRDGRLQQAA